MEREEDRRSIAVYYIHTLILDNINSTRVPFKYLHVTTSIAFRHLGPLLLYGYFLSTECPGNYRL